MGEYIGISRPPCAFEKCLFEKACRGYYEDNEINQFNTTEGCDESQGYANTCTDENKNLVRCPLCATCKGYKNSTTAYKRSGSGTKCKECPDPTTNKVFLGIGFLVMIIGCSVMIYMEINSEPSDDETADVIKKIILNFLQMVALAGGLPLRWPKAVENMFLSFSTVSSAGTTLMIPDCELSTMKTSDAFYYKQIAFTFFVPFIVVVCILSWSIIKCCGCAKRWKIRSKTMKDYIVLSIVLMLFLGYPSMVRMCLSMLKCYKFTTGGSYLLADLQEPCWIGRHSVYVLVLTIPQFLLCVLGLPLMAGLKILCNKDKLKTKHFYTRYGLLYIG